ncbi:hypothetical protein BH23THE1_BH23THE1_35970 [soil metagenome]
MNTKYINKTKMVFISTLLLLSVVSFTSASTALLQQVKATSHLTPDLPLTAEVCKHDTNPNGPSCKPDTRNTGLVPDLPLTAEVCKHDTNPNGPSCKPDQSSSISSERIIQ